MNSTPHSHRSLPSEADVVVVGAGLSGLSAARALRQRGLDVVVLEAADKVGGRVQSAHVAGAHVDLGGTFVGPGQDRIIALADEMGVSRYATYEHGDNALRWRGRTRRYSGTIPSIGPIGLLDLARIRGALEKIASRIPPTRPGDAVGAAALDAQSLGSWLRSKNAMPGTHDLLAAVCKTSWGCEPSEVSLLYVAHYVRLCGGFDRMLDAKGGAQEEHFVEGSHEIAARVATELGDAIHLSTPVQAAHWDDDGADITTTRGTVRARRVIFAIPPALRRRIDFAPSLPVENRYLAQRWSPGVLSKAYAVYERPFWRDNGLSGQTLSDTGPVFITFDAGPEDASRGVLLGFIGGDYARRWDGLRPEERRLRVLSSLADVFGPAALDAIGYVDQRWSTEEWIGGGPTAAPGPGSVAPYAATLARPIGPLHWAGTETADTWVGFMDGAVRAGERAAREVARELTRTSAPSLPKGDHA